MKKLLFVLVVAISFSSHARQDCPKGKVEYIQIENTYALVKLVGQQWRRIGNLADIGVRERFSLLMAAQMAGKEVVIGYPDGYDCNVQNFSTDMVIARSYN